MFVRAISIHSVTRVCLATRVTSSASSSEITACWSSLTLTLNSLGKSQHVYSVRFSARELWGQQASAQDSVNLDPDVTGQERIPVP
jgi:hypothetical protein